MKVHEKIPLGPSILVRGEYHSVSVKVLGSCSSDVYSIPSKYPNFLNKVNTVPDWVRLTVYSLALELGPTRNAAITIHIWLCSVLSLSSQKNVFKFQCAYVGKFQWWFFRSAGFWAPLVLLLWLKAIQTSRFLKIDPDLYMQIELCW